MTITEKLIALKTRFCETSNVFPETLDGNIRAADAEIFRLIGIPPRFADWYDNVPRVIGITSRFRGRSYVWNLSYHNMENGYIVAEGVMGSFLIDSCNGVVCFGQDDGELFAVNSSLYCFLFCISSFMASSRVSFVDAEERLLESKAVDPEAFRDSESPWNGIFSEAIAGMF